MPPDLRWGVAPGGGSTAALPICWPRPERTICKWNLTKPNIPSSSPVQHSRTGDYVQTEAKKC